MDIVAPPGLKLRSINSLQKFAHDHLLSADEWIEFDRVSQASKPKFKTILKDGYPHQIWEEVSPDYRRKLELEKALFQHFRDEIGSGRWAVTAIPVGQHSRQSIALELIENAKEISFGDNRIGRLSRVEIAESSGADRYTSIKWFIENVCAVFPPKNGIGKTEIQNLADRLLPFDVRDDLFKAAWADADIPPKFRQAGR